MNTENNKLIAEFLGYEDWTEYNSVRLRRKNLPDTFSHIIKYENLKYHKDWNSLMLVVEKIESLGWFIDIHNKNECTWSADYDNDSDIDKTFCVGTKLESTYHCVVRFIKWYNENK